MGRCGSRHALCVGLGWYKSPTKSKMPALRRDFEFGSLISHPRNDCMVDCFVMSPNAHKFWAIVEHVTELLEASGVLDFQVFVNHGHPARQFRTSLQIKLSDPEDRWRFMHPVEQAPRERRGQAPAQRPLAGAPVGETL